MLVLSRKENERIVIGQDITIEILSIVAGRVRLGITAPTDISIDRFEIHEQKERRKGNNDPPLSGRMR